MGGMIGELMLTLVPEAPGVPVMPALPKPEPVVLSRLSTLEVDVAVVLGGIEVAPVALLRVSLDVNALLDTIDVLGGVMLAVEGGCSGAVEVLSMDSTVKGV